MAHLGVVREAHQIPNHPFAHVIGRVGLTRHNQLNGVVRVQQEPLEPLGIPQHECQALVGGHSTGETYGQDVRVQHGVRPCQLGVGGAAFLPRGA